MVAKFIGTNSMGYKNGSIYVLTSTYNSGYFWIADINDKGRPVPYTNVDTFLDNWQVLSMSVRNTDKDVMEAINE